MYEVDFEKGISTECYASESQKVKMQDYTLFLDSKGAYVKTHNGDIYMTPNNSKII